MPGGQKASPESGVRWNALLENRMVGVGRGDTRNTPYRSSTSESRDGDSDSKIKIENNDEDDDIIEDEDTEEHINYNSSLDDSISWSSMPSDEPNFGFTVEALLALPACRKKYIITRDELIRRISPPETYSQTALQSYMRVRRDGSAIRYLLEKYKLTASKRLRIQESPFLRLCERECEDLANGIASINAEFFPHSTVAQKCFDLACETCSPADIKKQAKDTRRALEQIKTALDQIDLTEFSCVTHNFGPLNLKHHIDTLQQVFKLQAEIAENYGNSNDDSETLVLNANTSGSSDTSTNKLNRTNSSFYDGINYNHSYLCGFKNPVNLPDCSDSILNVNTHCKNVIDINHLHNERRNGDGALDLSCDTKIQSGLDLRTNKLSELRASKKQSLEEILSRQFERKMLSESHMSKIMLGDIVEVSTADEGQSDYCDKKENGQDIDSERDSVERKAVTVEGLLSVPPHKRKYEITKEELKRRIGSPERFTQTTFMSYLRKEKRIVSNVLNEFELVPSKRSRCQDSPFLKLCEKECEDFAKGIELLDNNFIPHKLIAAKCVELAKEKNNEEQIEHQINETRKALELVKKAFDMANAQNYINATHGFGPPHFLHVIDTILLILKEESKLLYDTL